MLWRDPIRKPVICEKLKKISFWFQNRPTRRYRKPVAKNFKYWKYSKENLNSLLIIGHDNGALRNDKLVGCDLLYDTFVKWVFIYLPN